MAAKVVWGSPQPTHCAGITRANCTVNGCSTWGSRLTCECGAAVEQTVGTSVTYEDGPFHFAYEHDCSLYWNVTDRFGRFEGRVKRDAEACDAC